MKCQSRLPVISLHGYGGFGKNHLFRFLSQDVSVDYFNKVEDAFQKTGRPYYALSVDPMGSTRSRAEEAADAIRKLRKGDLGQTPVHLIGHSAGGLDARVLAYHHREASIASVLTIGTPHKGTALANLVVAPFAWVSGMLGKERAMKAHRSYQRLLEMSIDHPYLRRALFLQPRALKNFTPTRMDEGFNNPESVHYVPDNPDVVYASVVARSPFFDLSPSGLLMKGTGLILRFMEGGSNDGMVTVDSQRYGEVLEEIRVNHIAQTGHGSFDAGAFYVRMAERLDSLVQR